jgi:hypothetical protein
MEVVMKNVVLSLLLVACMSVPLCAGPQEQDYVKRLFGRACLNPENACQIYDEEFKPAYDALIEADKNHIIIQKTVQGFVDLLYREKNQEASPSKAIQSHVIKRTVLKRAPQGLEAMIQKHQ